MRHFADMPTTENAQKPVYQQWGFWILLIASIVLSFASGALIRGGASLLG